MQPCAACLGRAEQAKKDQARREHEAQEQADRENRSAQAAKAESERREAESARSRRLKTLEGLNELTGPEFEQLVGKMFREAGYGASVCGGSGDDGIDLVLSHAGHKDVVQCKRWRNDIGSPIVRDFYGALLHANASHGFIVTTARVSDSARRFGSGKPISFIDGPTLLSWVEGTYRPTPPRPQGAPAFDPHAVLGVPRGAPRDAIRRAYLELAAKYHPDKVQHLGSEFQAIAEEKLKQFNKAYQQLSRGS